MQMFLEFFFFIKTLDSIIYWYILTIEWKWNLNLVRQQKVFWFFLDQIVMTYIMEVRVLYIG